MSTLHKVILRPWYYECGDHCCQEEGTELIVDGISVSKHFNEYNGDYARLIEELIKLCGGNATVEEEDDD